MLDSAKKTSPEKFDAALERGGFVAVERSIRQGDTQCFVCVHSGKNDKNPDQPYIVVAFRGSENDVGDWLTNADATPASEFNFGAVHQGFYKAYMSVQDEVLAAIAKARDDYGKDTPVFFTGHSLGGALAVVATRLNAAATAGACYTYGCPRVGNYEFFKGLKTPIYRIVNSSDLVPRVPPGAWSKLILGLLKLLAFVSAKSPWLSGLFESMKGFVDKINDYRHHGDMRFLPDLPSAKIEDSSSHIRQLQVLSNPNQLDMVQWFFRHAAVSFGMPVKSHSMKLYRNKLLKVANNRMEPYENGQVQI
ncbi:MAG: triacylglycerol lipase [Limisphaerales bacterium]